MEGYYQISIVEHYKCGACHFTTVDVKNLHLHMRQHSDSGSFFFCQDTRTAFPRYRQSHATTQTELLVEISSDDIIRTGNSLRFIPELDTSINKSTEQEERDQESDPKTTVQDASVLVDNMTDTLEEIQDYTDLQNEVVAKPESSPLVEIPLSYKYMSNEEILNVLLNEDPDVSGGNGGKKNYLVIRNEGYKGMPIFEDGVVWKSQSRKTVKQSFAIDADYNLSKVYKKGTYYYYKHLHQKQSHLERIEPQPRSIITFQKVTIELEGNESYRRRISRIAEAPEDLGFLTTKCLVEYYMDITSVRKVSVADSQVKVTIPDCTKLKEMLYPGVSKEVPEHDATTLFNTVKTDNDNDLSSFVVNNQEISDNVDVYQEDNDKLKNGEVSDYLVTQPVITSYQYLNNDELLQVILDDNASVDETKNYRVFTSNYNGFQRVDEFGFWQVNTTTNLTFSVNSGDECTLVIKKKGKYCRVLPKRSAKEYEELFPQPKNLLVLQRCTFKLKDSNSFLKRETVVWSAPERWSNLLHKHVTEYCSEKCIIPREEVDENGKTKLVILNRKLYPKDKAFQKELAITTADMNQKQNYLMQMSMACSSMSNEQILETLILDGTEGALKEKNSRNYMVIRNEKANGKSRFFLKDGCAWDNRLGTSVNQTFAIDESNNLTGVSKQGDKYCMKKRLDRKNVWVPVNPQPKDIITLHKYWTALKSCPFYRKRITSVIEAPDRLDFLKSKALVEYYTMSYSSSISIPMKLKEIFKGRENKGEQRDICDDTDRNRNQPLKRKFGEMEDADETADSSLDENTDEWKPKLDDSQVNSSVVDEETEEVAVYLPVTSMFMTGSQTWEVLLSEEPVSSVLSGPHLKEFIVVTTDETGEEGMKSVPCQDGLAWDGCSFQCTNQLFVLEGEKLGRTVMIKNGLYSVKRKKENTFVYETIKPQPKQIVTIRRTWIKLKSMPWYKKRCSKIIDAPEKFSHVKTKTVIEYLKQEIGENELDDVALLKSFTEISTQEKDKNAQPSSDQDMTETSEDESPIPKESIKTIKKKERSSKVKGSLVSQKSKSVYSKPYFTPPNEKRSYRSERLKNRQVKSLKISHEDDDPKEDQPETDDMQKTIIKDVTASPKENAASKKSSDPFSEEMMSTEDSFQVMLTETTVSSVRNHPEDKNFVVVEVEKDAADRRKILRDQYLWDSKTGTTINQKYSLTPDNKLTFVIEKEGKYYKKKRDNNKWTYELFDPQPKELVNLHRYWVKGKTTTPLVKRVTTVTEAPKRLSFLKSRVLIEYSTAPRLCFKSTV